MQGVKEGKEGLNGNENVEGGKDGGKEVIRNGNDLNEAEKDGLKEEVDAVETVGNVKRIKERGEDLNEGMTQLKEGIGDKEESKGNGKFVNADSDKENAYK
ncbi:GA module-containing protein, partial [Staphylococcus aureus]|uniref:GA module-containing protein n=1 Tax=Staphylococcus aureus TaxID=1280 RepID=UPI001642DBBB